MDVKGRWINPEGYALTRKRIERRLCLRRPIWEFHLEDPPLTYQTGQVFIQPDRHAFELDFGSIPITLRPVLPSEEFLGYIFHDSAYREHGLYFAPTPLGPFEFQPITRRQADDLLREMIVAEGGSQVRAALIWSAVRCFGPRW